MLSLLLYEIRARRTPIIAWGIGLSFYAALYIGIYPQAAQQMTDLADIDIYEVMGMSLGSFEGYLGSTVLLLLPLILGIYAVVAGTGTLAGEEERGTLELLITTRLTRWQIVTAKAIALAVVLLIILTLVGGTVTLMFNSIADQVQTTVTGGSLFVLFLAAWPLVVAFGMLGLFLGALLPTRRLALTIAVLIFLASYLGENIAGMVSSLDWVKPLSLFTYRDTTPAVFVNGVSPADTGVLVGVALLFFALALFFMERRDVTVGAWPWQRPPKVADGSTLALDREPQT